MAYLVCLSVGGFLCCVLFCPYLLFISSSLGRLWLWYFVGSSLICCTFNLPQDVNREIKGVKIDFYSIADLTLSIAVFTYPVSSRLPWPLAFVSVRSLSRQTPNSWKQTKSDKMSRTLVIKFSFLINSDKNYFRASTEYPPPPHQHTISLFCFFMRLYLSSEFDRCCAHLKSRYYHVWKRFLGAANDVANNWLDYLLNCWIIAVATVFLCFFHGFIWMRCLCTQPLDNTVFLNLLWETEYWGTLLLTQSLVTGPFFRLNRSRN